jgi:ribosomal protein L17
MGKFKVEITVGDDAMRTPDDVAKALREIADQLITAPKGGLVSDRNGNVVGRFRLVGGWPE